MTSYNTLLSFHKEAENRYYTDCEWTKNKSIQKFKHLPQKRFPFFFYTWQSQSMLYRLFPLSTLLLTYYSSSKNICECHQETLNRAIVSKNSKSSIKTREREREREREEEEEEEEAPSQISNRQKTRKKKQKTKEKNKEKETDSMMELRKPTKMKVHTFVFFVLFFCEEKIGSQGRRNN
jgi:hypothetical protein